MKGHRSLLLVTQQASNAVRLQRMNGLQAACEEADAPVTFEMLHVDREVGQIKKSLSERLSGPSRPTALIVANNQLAVSTIETLRAIGLRYPDDLSLITLDHPEWVDLVEPPVSHVTEPHRELAALAWNALTERMAHPESPTRRTVLDAEIVWRE